LTFTCSVPAGFLLPARLDFDDMPVYAQWNAAYTSLVYQAARPLTNGQWWSSAVDLVASNAWLRPPVYAKRTVAPTRLVSGNETVQTVVCDVFVPPGALNGMEIFSVQLILHDLDLDDLDVSVISNSCSSTAFLVRSRPFGTTSRYRTKRI